MAPEISVVVLACRKAVVEIGQDGPLLFKLKVNLERLFLAGKRLVLIGGRECCSFFVAVIRLS